MFCKGYERGYNHSCEHGYGNNRICKNTELRMQALKKYLKKVKYNEWLEGNINGEAHT
jgi:hypothetical protein